MKIDGREIAKEILSKLKKKVEDLKKQNIIPHLVIILVGNDPASVSYVRQKEIKAKEIGAKVTVYNLEFKIQNSKLLKLIHKLNHEQKVHGIIIQRPLPEQINEGQISRAVDLKKDIDSFHPQSKFPIPVVRAILKILGNVINVNELKNKSITIFGKGKTGGAPIIKMFKKMNLKPKVIDSKTQNPQILTKNADIIISAVGKPHIINPRMIKRGVILISVGQHKNKDGKFHGDYEENEIKNIASFYTPTPGGVGPVNVACLLKNLIQATGKLSN